MEAGAETVFAAVCGFIAAAIVSRLDRESRERKVARKDVVPNA
jgi:hypothetical protein